LHIRELYNYAEIPINKYLQGENMKIETLTLHGKELHNFFSSIVAPRPIAFISTVDAEGRYNAAPFSAFNYLTLNPPIVAFGAGRRGNKKKDTILNIEAVGDFVVNMVDENLAEAMNQAAAAYAPGIDEIREVGLTALPSEMVKSPRIAEAPISLECRLVQILELGHKPTRSTIILGEVLMVHVKDDVLTQGKIDPLKAKIIARMGDNDIYCRTTDIFKMKRL
jgi:flavin reductase (DIM6/NTAB) family NADH-FMN oxidoreductase RutF